MRKLTLFLIILFYTQWLFSQDVIYSISGLKDGEPTYLDSILFENLTNSKRLLFGNLPEQISYNINLSKKTVTSIGILDANKKVALQIVKNVPGEVNIYVGENYRGKSRLRIFDLSGKKLFSQTIHSMKQGDIITVRLKGAGLYILNLNTQYGSLRFKAMGSYNNPYPDFQIGFESNPVQSKINLQDKQIKNHLLADDDFSFETGDSIRVTAFLNGYYTYPHGTKITGSKSINFDMLISTVDSTGISDVYNPISTGDYTILDYDTINGGTTLVLTTDTIDLKPGDIITLDLDTTGLIQKVVSVNNENGSITITTEAAFMNDLFVKQEFKLNTALIEPNKSLKSSSSPKEIIQALTDEQGYIHPVKVIYYDENGEKITKSALKGDFKSEGSVNIIDFLKDFSNTDLYGEEGDNIHFYIEEGYASLKSDAVFEFEFKYEGELTEDTKVKKGDLDYFKFYLDNKAGFQTKLALDMNYAVEKEDEKKLFNMKKATAHFVVPPGIPVWITFDCDIYGNYHFDADASLHADWGFENHHQLQAGGIYERATNTFTPYSDYTPENIIYPLNINGEVNAFARFELYPRVDVKLYNFFGPYAEIVPFVESKYNAALQSQITSGGNETFLAWNSSIDLGLDLRVGTELSFLGLFEREYGPEIIHCFNTPLWKSPVRIEILTELPAQVEAGSTIELQLKVSDYLDLPVPLCPVYFSGDGEFSKQLPITDPNGIIVIYWQVGASASEKSYTATIYDAANLIIDELSGSVSVVASFPTITTNDISTITQTTATSGGNITDDGGSTVTGRGVCWNTSTSPTTANSHTADGSGTGTFTSSITGLTAGIIYYVRAYATNSEGTAYGNQQSFTTTASIGMPTLNTNAISSITETTATSGGNITDDGGATVTTRGVCWSTSTNPTTANNKTTVGSGTGSFTSSLTGLTASTTYYVRAYATNSLGTAYGNEQTFTTTSTAGLPNLTTDAASSITESTATSGGNITDDGGATVTTRGVCWSTSQNPTIANSKTNDGTGTGDFLSSVTGLTAGTTYYLRAYATNSTGTAYGEEKTFITKEDITGQTGTITDYDGNTYNTIGIGGQMWMAENLKVIHYANSTAIPLETDNTAWVALGDNNTDKAYCYYNNDANGEKDTYGALYTYAAATNGDNDGATQGACPTGWHLPSDAQWKELEMYLGMSQTDANATGWRGIDEGSKLAGNSSMWLDGVLDSNAAFGTSGFLALPCGRRYTSGAFENVNSVSFWWMSNAYSSIDGRLRTIGYSRSSIGRGNNRKSIGLSVRCIKD